MKSMTKLGLVAMAALLSAIVGCSSVPSGGSEAQAPCAAKPGELAHVVLFWLKPGAPAQTQAELAEACGTLRGIPGVRAAWAGKPNMTPRPVVDNSYAVGLVVVMEGPHVLPIYNQHPLHQALVQRFTPHIERFLVYDVKGE